MLSAVYSVLAFLPPLVLALFLAVGWLATAHVTYDATTSRVPAAALRLVQLFDRILAGQIIIFYGIARYAAMLREFLAGLVNLGVHEREEAAAAGTPATPLAAGSPLGGWLAKAMKAATTASRVQSRMYGHVVREIAFNTGEPAGAEAGGGQSTPTTPIAGLLSMMLRGPLASQSAPSRRHGQVPVIGGSPKPGGLPLQGSCGDLRRNPSSQLSGVLAGRSQATGTLPSTEPEAAAGRAAFTDRPSSRRTLAPLLVTDLPQEPRTAAHARTPSGTAEWSNDERGSAMAPERPSSPASLAKDFGVPPSGEHGVLPSPAGTAKEERVTPSGEHSVLPSPAGTAKGSDPSRVPAPASHPAFQELSDCPSLSELGQSGGRRRPAGSASFQGVDAVVIVQPPWGGDDDQSDSEAEEQGKRL
jgi:hypothetical protein